MAWYYVLNGASHGPVAEADLRALRTQNVVALDTPVWTDGMAEWLPFSNSPLAIGGASAASVAVAAGAPGTTHNCVQCGQLFSEDQMLNYEGSWVCAACKPVFFQRIKEGVTAPGTLVYSSARRRFVAIVLDTIIMWVVLMVPIVILSIALAALHPGQNADGPPAWFMTMFFFLYLIPPAYEIFMIGKYGATWGKMIMKVKVVRPDGERISYGRSTGRYFAKILSGMILCIGYLMAIWDKEKRSLHDQICQTRVIRSLVS